LKFAVSCRNRTYPQRDEAIRSYPRNAFFPLTVTTRANAACRSGVRPVRDPTRCAFPFKHPQIWEPFLRHFAPFSAVSTCGFVLNQRLTIENCTAAEFRRWPPEPPRACSSKQGVFSKRTSVPTLVNIGSNCLFQACQTASPVRLENAKTLANIGLARLHACISPRPAGGKFKLNSPSPWFPFPSVQSLFRAF